MEFTIKSGSPEKQRSACVVVGVFDNRKLSLSAELIDRASERLCQRDHPPRRHGGQARRTLLLHNVRGTLADRVLLVGLGKERDFRDKRIPLGDPLGGQLLNETGSYEAVVYLTEEKVKRREVAWRVEHAVVVAMEAVYRFEQMKSEPAEVRRPLRKLTLSVPQRSDLADGETAAARGLAIAHGMDLARDLGNLPGNVCTPKYLAERAHELARVPDVKVQGAGARRDRGARHGLVPVGHPRQRRAAALHRAGVRRCARKKQKPVVIVGKGITFDTGGISLKPAADMDHMKYDMCGAASVFGAFRAVAELKAKVNLVGLVPACENMPSGRATKPGDIVKSMSGQTIEILNTDAEGRLILCDALTYAERYEPEAVVDMATLTGAMVVALGHVACGVFSNNDSAGARAGRGRRRRLRSRLAAAAVGRLPGRPRQQLRRLRQRRGARGRQHHGGVLPVAVREEVRMGASRHRGHRVQGRQGERRDRAAGAVLDHLAAVAGGEPRLGAMRGRRDDDDRFLHACRRIGSTSRRARREGLRAAWQRARADARSARPPTRSIGGSGSSPPPASCRTAGWRARSRRRRRSGSTTRSSTRAGGVLVNLPRPAPFFSRFERLAEIVGTDDDEASARRASASASTANAATRCARTTSPSADMPTARELLEQAEALMRRDRMAALAADDDFPLLTDAVPARMRTCPARRHPMRGLRQMRTRTRRRRRLRRT